VLLGVSEVVCLHYPDGEVENTARLRGDLVQWIRTFRPDVVFTHDPEHTLPAYLCHPDHRVVGRATLDAIYPLARDHLAFADRPSIAGLPPHAVQRIWLFASDQPDTVVDIVAGFDRKIQARLAHVSQTPDPADLAAQWQRRAAHIGASGPVPLGEAFAVLQFDA
jgi:LmbE family N-acetylglucosaminyl deacetylase